MEIAIPWAGDYIIDQEQKTLFGKTVKVDKEEYEDLVSTMEDSIKMARQFYDESEISHKKMEHAEKIAKQALRQRDKALEERDEAVREKDRFVEEATAPLKRKIKQLEETVRELEKKFSKAIEKIKSFEWMKFIHPESRENHERIQDEAKERMHAKERIGEIDRQIHYWENDGIDYAMHHNSTSFGSDFIDVDEKVDELKKEKYILMVENDFPVPQELEDHIAYLNEMEESREEHDLDLDMER